jgi:Tfp pilus assembly protein PilO
MKSVFDKLNLRPQERRLVVIVAIVVFAVVNVWFVFPHFGDLGRTQQKKRDAEKLLSKYKGELAKKDQYDRDLKRLEAVGAYLPSEEQALELQREAYLQAQQAQVAILRSDPGRPTLQRTNSFFEEQTLVITVLTGEKELIDFLYGLGKGQSLTRVSSMNLQRDPSQTKLSGNITLVKSYQKKPPKVAPTPVVAAAAGKPAAPKPATTPAPSGTKGAPAVLKSGTNAPAVNTKTPPAANTNSPRRAAPPPAKK